MNCYDIDTMGQMASMSCNRSMYRYQVEYVKVDKYMGQGCVVVKRPRVSVQRVWEGLLRSGATKRGAGPKVECNLDLGPDPRLHVSIRVMTCTAAET